MKQEIKIFNLNKYQDNRGFFVENFPDFIGKDLGMTFIQDNLSFSKRGVVRGLHYQWQEPMGKLVNVISGSIIDYVVDIREGSETFGKSFSFELDSRADCVLWVPPGFAHGFEAIEDSYVFYKCTSKFNPKAEDSINFFDDHLEINLQTKQKDIIMSKRDLEAISFLQYCKDPKFFKEKK